MAQWQAGEAARARRESMDYGSNQARSAADRQAQQVGLQTYNTYLNQQGGQFDPNELRKYQEYAGYGGGPQSPNPQPQVNASDNARMAARRGLTQSAGGEWMSPEALAERTRNEIAVKKAENRPRVISGVPQVPASNFGPEGEAILKRYGLETLPANSTDDADQRMQQARTEATAAMRGAVDTGVAADFQRLATERLGIYAPKATQTPGQPGAQEQQPVFAQGEDPMAKYYAQQSARGQMVGSQLDALSRPAPGTSDYFAGLRSQEMATPATAKPALMAGPDQAQQPEGGFMGFVRRLGGAQQPQEQSISPGVNQVQSGEQQMGFTGRPPAQQLTPYEELPFAPVTPQEQAAADSARARLAMRAGLPAQTTGQPAANPGMPVIKSAQEKQADISEGNAAMAAAYQLPAGEERDYGIAKGRWIVAGRSGPEPKKPPTVAAKEGQATGTQAVGIAPVIDAVVARRLGETTPTDEDSWVEDIVGKPGAPNTNTASWINQSVVAKRREGKNNQQIIDEIKGEAYQAFTQNPRFGGDKNKGFYSGWAGANLYGAANKLMIRLPDLILPVLAANPPIPQQR
jgi:hypothetical protein